MKSVLSLPNKDPDVLILPSQEHDELECLKADTIVHDEEELDRLLDTSSEVLFEHATQCVRRRLKETKRWENTVACEKLGLRLAYELTERFGTYARTKLPVRPLLLLDAFITQSFSQVDFLSQEESILSSPLGQYLDTIISRAVVSRDALVTLFWHLYSMTPSHVMKVLGILEDQQARIFKNYARWRKAGWRQSMMVGGLSEERLADLETEVDRNRMAINKKVRHILDRIQPYYRKSEPLHYHCRGKDAWLDLYADGYDQEYRLWHLAMCQPCFKSVCEIQLTNLSDELQPLIHFQVRPYGNEISPNKNISLCNNLFLR